MKSTRLLDFGSYPPDTKYFLSPKTWGLQTLHCLEHYIKLQIFAKPFLCQLLISKLEKTTYSHMQLHTSL